MFAKVTNNSIETYPYNPQVDHPLTSFPVGASYPAFDCYWVHPKPQDNPDPTTLQAVETTPVFNQQAARWEQAWDYEPLPPPPPVADWDGFNEYMMADPTFKAYRDTARTVDGDINSAVYDGYSLVATNGVGAFSLVWSSWCQASGITTEDRNVVADSAEGFNLPAEFVNVIRG